MSPYVGRTTLIIQDDIETTLFSVNNVLFNKNFSAVKTWRLLLYKQNNDNHVTIYQSIIGQDYNMRASQINHECSIEHEKSQNNLLHKSYYFTNNISCHQIYD